MTPLMLLSDIIREVMEEHHLLYCSYPYPCSMEEACTHTKFSVYSYVVKEIGDKEVRIILTPNPMSGKRKKFVIRCWA